MPSEKDLRELQQLTDALANGRSNPELVLARARKLRSMGYDDLAVADAYYALTLVEADDPDFSDLRIDRPDDPVPIKSDALFLLQESLRELGCLQDACTFHMQLRELIHAEPRIAWGVSGFPLIDKYHQLRPNAKKVEDFSQFLQIRQTLPNQGLAYRIVYPWNLYEPNRTSNESLAEINNKLQAAAPSLEARATELPVLGAIGNADAPVTNIQLGLFANTDLEPSSTILRERSIITAIHPIDASLCDLCASPLPDLTSSTPPVACPECSTTVFCSEACLDFALKMYHKPPFCGNDDGLDEIGRDANAPYPAEDLYFLLVARTIAMAEAQDVHPLELFETKYLCGEFTEPPVQRDWPLVEPVWPGEKDKYKEWVDEVQRSKTLPFSFMHNVVLPFRFFITLMLSDESLTPYSSKWIERYDHWVIQTLYAKFRGVASANQSTWDAKPEVAAVHPLWCLANHSCNPNVRWQWGGHAQESEIRYIVRDALVWQDPSKAAGEYAGFKKEVDEDHTHIKADVPEYTSIKKGEYIGIKKDEEIMNHYVDIDLMVKERREYAMGPLGGECRCERCVWEANEMKVKMANYWDY
jgi:hypothetical protein